MGAPTPSTCPTLSSLTVTPSAAAAAKWKRCQPGAVLPTGGAPPEPAACIRVVSTVDHHYGVYSVLDVSVRAPSIVDCRAG
jgi:hypothetical protein